MVVLSNCGGYSSELAIRRPAVADLPLVDGGALAGCLLAITLHLLCISFGSA